MKIKSFFLPAFLLLILTTCFFSCKKESSGTSSAANSLSLLNGPWSATAWSGISGGLLTATIDAGGADADVTFSSSATGFKVGDSFFTKIIYNAPGRFNATARFTYGAGNASVMTRAVILTLQNNNTQLTVDYVAVDANTPEVITVFQKGNLTF